MTTLRLLTFCCALTAAIHAQQFQFNLDNLAAKASEAVDVSLNGATLQLAGKFLDAKNPDDANVKKLLSQLEGIYVKSYEFKSEGVWSQADLDRIRTQLRTPEWSRIVNVVSAADHETAEVYVRTENKKMTGLAILAAEPKELTVVNIVGAIDLDALAELGGHFGVPKDIIPAPKKK